MPDDILFRPILPHMIVIGCAMAVLMTTAFARRGCGGAGAAWAASLCGLLAALAVCASLWGGEPVSAFGGMVALDGFSLILCVIVLVAAILAVLLSTNYVERIGIAQGEYYALLLLATSGMMLLGSATDLVTVFLGIEIMSIAIYVLVGFNHARPQSAEAALKYLLLGAFASGFLLYGIALVYGSTGSTNLAEIARYFKPHDMTRVPPTFLIGIGLLVVGFGFKVGAVPFHMWTPDVYQGAPTSITAFMATGVKAAAFAALLRVFYFAFPNLSLHWAPVLQGLAIATMIVGNLMALTQTNIKRMLAYSSIAHAGYILVGLVAVYDKSVAAEAASSIFFYLLAYTVMNAGAFGVVIMLGRDKEEMEELDDYKGLAVRRPWMAFLLALFLLSLAGLPPTAGFAGKFFIFATAMRAGFEMLVVIGVLNSALSVYYYLRPLVIMYMQEPEDGVEAENGAAGRPFTLLAIVFSAAATVELGVAFLPWISGGPSYFEILLRSLASVI